MTTSYKRRHGRLVARAGEGTAEVFAAYSFKTGRFQLSLPDHEAEGFYLRHLKNLPEEDARNLARALDELLTLLDRGVDPDECEALAAAEAAAKLARAGGEGDGDPGEDGANWRRLQGGHYATEYGDDMLEVIDTREVGSACRWRVVVNGQEVGTAPRYRLAKRTAIALVTTPQGGDSCT